MNKTLRKRGGIAMVLVVVLMAAAAIMGFALLSSASMQSQASKNATSSVSADGLIQSGANLAMYYLMNPDKADTTRMTTTGSITFYNPGANVPAMNLSNGSSVSRIDVSLISKGNYNIDVTAASTSNGTTITRCTRTVVAVPQRYVPKYSMAHNGAFTMPLTWLTSSIGGSVRCDGGYGGLLSAVTGLLFGTADQALPTYPQHACPTYSQLNLCKYLVSNSGRYLYNNGTYTANLISSSSVDSTKVTGANATTNPGNVFYITSDADLSGTINFNGTLIATSGVLLGVKNGANVTITPKPGYPALIAGKDVVFKSNNNKLTVNGVCWIGGNLTGSGTLPAGQLIVNGSLMWGGTSSCLDSTKLLGLTSKLTVTWPNSASTYDSPTPDVLYTPELSDYDQMPKSVKIVSTAVLAH